MTIQLVKEPETEAVSLEEQRHKAEQQARYQTRKALLIQLYSLEDVMVIYGDLKPENTLKAIKERCK